MCGTVSEQRLSLVRLPGCFGALGPACPLKAASCAAHPSLSLACGGSSPPFFPLFSFFPFPGPFIPFLQIQTVLSQIQMEEMFSSCFTKGVRLLSSFSMQPGRA